MLALCRSSGQLITLVWGLVTGHHHPALCCCQEPFTPSSFSPNGTSESIKTIITANPTESKEIILGGQRKHGWGVWIYLSGERVDVHLARQPITVSIVCICLVWIHWRSQQGFFFPFRDAKELLIVHRCRSCILISLGGRRPLVWWETEIYVWLCWTGYRPYQRPCFYSHHGLMNRSQLLLDSSSARTSTVPPKGQ